MGKHYYEPILNMGLASVTMVYLTRCSFLMVNLILSMWIIVWGSHERISPQLTDKCGSQPSAVNDCCCCCLKAEGCLSRLHNMFLQISLCFPLDVISDCSFMNAT